jgi:hypothetical protein
VAEELMSWQVLIRVIETLGGQIKVVQEMEGRYFTRENKWMWPWVVNVGFSWPGA